MLKLVTEKIREIIKNHVSLNSKIIEIHWKFNGFWCFRRLHVRVVKVSKKHQKGHQNPSEIEWKINQKIMFFLSRFLNLLFLILGGIFFKNGRFGDPLENPMGSKIRSGSAEGPSRARLHGFRQSLFPYLALRPTSHHLFFCYFFW